jgi:hypothetical protein
MSYKVSVPSDIASDYYCPRSHRFQEHDTKGLSIERWSAQYVSRLHSRGGFSIGDATKPLDTSVPPITLMELQGLRSVTSYPELQFVETTVNGLKQDSQTLPLLMTPDEHDDRTLFPPGFGREKLSGLYTISQHLTLSSTDSPSGICSLPRDRDSRINSRTQRRQEMTVSPIR